MYFIDTKLSCDMYYWIASSVVDCEKEDDVAQLRWAFVVIENNCCLWYSKHSGVNVSS